MYRPGDVLRVTRFGYARLRKPFHVVCVDTHPYMPDTVVLTPLENLPRRITVIVKNGMHGSQCDLILNLEGQADQANRVPPEAWPDEVCAAMAKWALCKEG